MFEKQWLQWIFSIYSLIIRVGSNLQSIFLLYMRVTWGHQFLLSGLNKLHNIDHTAYFFTSLSIPFPVHHAYLVSWFEVIGGIFFILGFASRLSAIPLSIIMFTALGTAHAPVVIGFRFLTNPTLFAGESPYPFLLTAILLFIFGPGKFSLDGWLKRWVSKQERM
jgi:putative oxidoreductase